MSWLMGAGLTIWWVCERVDVITRRQAIIAVALEVAFLCGAGFEAAYRWEHDNECIVNCTALTALDSPTCAWMCR